MNATEWQDLVCAARDLTENQKTERIYDFANAISAIICSFEPDHRQIQIANIAYDHMVQTISLNAQIIKARR